MEQCRASVSSDGGDGAGTRDVSRQGLSAGHGRTTHSCRTMPLTPRLSLVAGQRVTYWEGLVDTWRAGLLAGWPETVGPGVRAENVGLGLGP